MKRPRLLLADDHCETRKLLRALLEVDFDLMADVEDGPSLVHAAEASSPDVIVTDISMPGLDGLAAAATILRRNPSARIVLVTVNADRDLAERGRAIGALGFVLKLEVGEELVPAVHAALRNESQIERFLHRGMWTVTPS